MDMVIGYHFFFASQLKRIMLSVWLPTVRLLQLFFYSISYLLNFKWKQKQRVIHRIEFIKEWKRHEYKFVCYYVYTFANAMLDVRMKNSISFIHLQDEWKRCTNKYFSLWNEPFVLWPYGMYCVVKIKVADKSATPIWLTLKMKHSLLVWNTQHRFASH